jgi:ferrous iron transport protein B
MAQEIVRVALAGNPNCGKTTLFNALTGARQQVGNYPGVTVEKKEGRFKHSEQIIEVADLPGTYSLTSWSPEERIARREILSGRFDVVAVVVDSTNLRRNLYLLTQVMLAGANPILVLNMADEARRSGQKLDQPQLERLLGFPVVETIGHKGGGIDILKKTILTAAQNPIKDSRLVLGERLDAAIGRLEPLLVNDGPEARPPRWLALKVLEGDPQAVIWVRKHLPDQAEAVLKTAQQMGAQVEEETGLDITTFIADRHYGFVAGLLHEVVSQPARADAHATTHRIDAVLCNRFAGPIFFLASMYLLFYLTFTLGDYPMSWIESLFGWAGSTISGFWPEGSNSPLRSLLVDGVIGGVGGVVVFLPNIVLLFLGLAFLEDSGYMSRAAFLVDRVMHKIGLHGKSFIPLVTGFGCTIPGIMATRTLENERDRLTTMLVLPLISCGARLPIWLLLIPAFFPEMWRAPMLFGVYLFGIALAAAMAKLLRVTLLKGEEAPFVMELPPYRLPTLKAVLIKSGERAWLYMRKAGTVILGISILLWVLSAYPKPDGYRIDRAIESGQVQVTDDREAAHDAGAPHALQQPEHQTDLAGVQKLTRQQVNDARAAENLDASIAGRVGRWMEPLIAPMGFDARIGTALIGAVAAKEVFVSQMGIVFSLGESDYNSESLRQKLTHAYNPVIALSLMIFLLVATPCFATIIMTRRESGSWKWAMLQLFGLTGLAWILSTTVYQIGRLLFL